MFTYLLHRQIYGRPGGQCPQTLPQISSRSSGAPRMQENLLAARAVPQTWELGELTTLPQTPLLGLTAPPQELHSAVGPLSRWLRPLPL